MALIDAVCREAACSPPLRAAQIFSSALLAVLFLQSGLDKVLDRRGNLEWLTSHFASSPLAGFVPLLLAVLTLTELAAGGAAALGVVALVTGAGTGFALDGIALSALALLMLFLGQRLAKDYAGAAVIVTYFVLTLVAFALHAPGLAR
jgi:hypothetical protein